MKAKENEIVTMTIKSTNNELNTSTLGEFEERVKRSLKMYNIGYPLGKYTIKKCIKEGIETLLKSIVESLTLQVEDYLSDSIIITDDLSHIATTLSEEIITTLVTFNLNKKLGRSTAFHLVRVQFLNVIEMEFTYKYVIPRGDGDK